MQFCHLPLSLTLLFFCFCFCLFVYLLLLFFLTGEHNRTKDEGKEQYFDVSQLYLNKHFQTYSGYGHDIALIRLSRPAILNRYVSLVCLPRQNERVATGKLCYFTGNAHLKVVMVISLLKISLSWVTHHLDGLLTYFLTRWEKKISIKNMFTPSLSSTNTYGIQGPERH